MLESMLISFFLVSTKCLEVVCLIECRMQPGSSRLRVPPPRTVSISLQTIVVAITKILRYYMLLTGMMISCPALITDLKWGLLLRLFGISINH